MQARKQEYIDAAGYASATLKENKQINALIGRAEGLKELEYKLMRGGFPTAEEIAALPAVNGQILFGYTEQERIAKLNEAYKHV